MKCIRVWPIRVTSQKTHVQVNVCPPRSPLSSLLSPLSSLLSFWRGRVKSLGLTCAHLQCSAVPLCKQPINSSSVIVSYHALPAGSSPLLYNPGFTWTILISLFHTQADQHTLFPLEYCECNQYVFLSLKKRRNQALQCGIWQGGGRHYIHSGFVTCIRT